MFQSPAVRSWRTRRHRTRFLAAGLVVAALVTTGCTAASGGSSNGGDASGGSSDRKNTIVVAYNNEVTTLDPARSDYLQVDNVDQALYDTLLGYTDGKMVPQLATEFTYSADVKSVNITLKAGPKFHSGNPVTAADVVYTLDRDKQLGKGIIGQISSYASAKATDDTHLTITLSQPDALFMGALSRIYIVDSKLVQQNAGSDMGQNWLLTHDAGSGPYQLVSSSAGTITTSRFDGYFAFDAKRPTTMTFRRIDELATIQAELKAGTVDIGPVPPTSASDLQSAGLKTEPTPGGSQAIIYFNNTTGKAANKAVRQALLAAFDYTGAIKSIYNGQGTVANGVTPTTMSCRPSLPTQAQDLDKAKKILADAGLAGTTLTMRYQPVFAQQAAAATLLQSDLKQIGVTLDLQPIAFADYLTSLTSFKTIPDIMLLTESAPFPDTGVMITKTYWSKSVGTNKAAYSNPKVDALIEKANATPSADTRCDLYSQAQQLIADDSAAMALYTVPGTVGYRSDLGGTTAMAAPGGLSYKALTVG